MNYSQDGKRRRILTERLSIVNLRGAVIEETTLEDLFGYCAHSSMEFRVEYDKLRKERDKRQQPEYEI